MPTRTPHPHPNPNQVLYVQANPTPTPNPHPNPNQVLYVQAEQEERDRPLDLPPPLRDAVEREVTGSSSTSSRLGFGLGLGSGSHPKPSLLLGDGGAAVLGLPPLARRRVAAAPSHPACCARAPRHAEQTCLKEMA